MAEETTTTTTQDVQKPAEASEQTPERQQPPDENLVGEARRKQRKAEQEAQELRERLEQLEDKDRSEVERAQRRAEQAEQRAQEFEERTTRLEKGGWVQAAARKLNFHDPSDAVAAADLSTIESEKDAARFAESLSKSKPHLVKPKDTTRDADKLGRVLNQGKPENPREAAEQARSSQLQQDAEAAFSAINEARRAAGLPELQPKV